MTHNLQTTLTATGLALMLSLYAPAQQGQTGTTGSGSNSGSAQSQTGAQTGRSDSQAPRTNTQGTQSDTQTGRADAASSSRNPTDEAKSMVGPAEQRFMNEAAHGSQAEIQLAQLAQKQGESEQVKSLAQRIEQDHQAASKELEALASRRGVSLPSGPDPKHQAHMDKLSKLQGAAFDRAYTKMMVSEHKKEVSKFQRASNNLMDTDLKAFAAKTLPNLQEHLRMAQEAANQKSSASGTRTRSADTNRDNANTTGRDNANTTGTDSTKK
jgi:putative membrane protein